MNHIPLASNQLADAVRSAFYALQKRRPVFSDEKDFQRELSCEMKKAGLAGVTLEEPVRLEALGNCRIDIFAEGVAVELKYKPKAFCVRIGDQVFSRERDDDPVFGKGKIDEIEEDLVKVALLMANKVEVGFVILLINRPFAGGAESNLRSLLHKYCACPEEGIWSNVKEVDGNDLVTRYFLVEVCKP